VLDTRCFARSGRGTWFEEGETSLANTGKRRTASVTTLYTDVGVKPMAKESSKKIARARPGNLVGEVAARLREGIRSGAFPAGHALREAELAKDLGTSRVPVREALHRLEGEGLVEIRPNHGASVVSISERELVEIAEVCRLLEGHLLRRAIPALTGEDLAAAGELLDELESVQDLAEWSRVNWRFHTRLYRAAERPLAVEILTGLRARAESAMQLLIATPERRATLNREHRAILASVRARRVKEALGLLDAHLGRSKDVILDLVDEGSAHGL